MLPTLMVSAMALLAPSTTLPGTDSRHVLPSSSSRRALLSTATSAFVVGRLCTSPASAATYMNQAEEKLAAILAKKVKEREESLGFTLDADDIRELENVLRNKYCGSAGMYSGEPGGTCAESPRAEATCFKATGFAASCTKSFGT